MAVAFEGFSIREYAAKMRTVDVMKCYPFKTDDTKKKKKKKEDVEALLPPITVTKFKWWAHELHRLRASNNTTHHHHQEMLTLVNKESSEIPRNDIEFTAVGDDEVEVESEESPNSSAEPSSLVCPVCKDFSAATVNGVNAHMDSCLAQASRDERKLMRKGKSKAPKKRSIADIFAVAPQIETHADQGYEMISDEEDDVDSTCKLLGESNSNGASTSVSKMKAKKVKKRKKEKQKVLLLEDNNKKKFNNNIKKKNIDGSIAKKDNSGKLKLQSPVSFAKKLKKRYAMDIWDAVTVRARTPNLKYLSAKKRKLVQTSKSIPKHQKPTFAVRSILKNHEVCGHNSTFCSMQGDSQSNPCGIQHSERHVRFSDKDHILGPRKKGVSSFELHNNAGNLISDSGASSSDKDQSAESNKEASPMEVDSGENDASTGSDNSVTEACSIIGRKELLKTPDEIPRFLRPHVTHQEIVKHLPDKSVPANRVAIDDNNLSLFNQGYPTTSHKPAYAGIQRLISALEEPCVSTQEVTVSRAFDSCGKMIDQVVRPIHGFAAMSSKANTGAFPAPSSSNFILNEHAKGRLPFPSQSEIDKFSDRDLHSRSLCPPMDLMRGPYPFPEWKQRVTVRERCADDDFVGLPLNSHGELIQLSPGGRSGFNQLRKLNATPGSSSSLPGPNFTQLTSMSCLPEPQNFTHRTSIGDSLTAYNNHFPDRELPNDQLNLFPMQNYVKENPSSHLPDRFGVTYLENTQRANIHQLDFESRSSHCSFRPLDPDLNRMNISTSRCRQVDQVQNQNIGRMISKESSGHMSQNSNQPTMRLMGKDVAIGKSSREVQRFEDGKVWTDKEIIAEHCRTSTTLHNSSFDRNFQQNWFPHTASGKLKEFAPHSIGFHNELTPLQNLLMKTPEPRFPHPYHNWQSNSVFQNGSLNRNPSANLIHFSQLPTSPAMFNAAPNFQEQFITGGESLQSLQFGSRLPAFSAPQNTCGHGILRPAEFSYKQNPPHFTKSAFEFPVLNPECRENVQSPWFQSSSKGLPPWLLHATLPEKAPHTASQGFPYVGSNHHQHIMPTANTFRAPSMHHSSQVSYPCNSMPSHSQLTSSLSQATTSLPPLAPAIRGNPKPTSVGDRSRIKVKDRLKSKAVSIKEPYPCKKTKRRAVRAVDSPKPPGVLNLQMKEKMNAVAGSSRGDFFSEMQSNLRATDLDSSWKKASDLSCCLHETQKDGFETVGIDSSGVDGTVRSSPIKSSAAGPIKLCAGAKHILKPTQIVDQDSSRPNHSTIPFVAATNGCKVLEPQKNSTKVYRF